MGPEPNEPGPLSAEDILVERARAMTRSTRMVVVAVAVWTGYALALMVQGPQDPSVVAPIIITAVTIGLLGRAAWQPRGWKRMLRGYEYGHNDDVYMRGLPFFKRPGRPRGGLTAVLADVEKRARDGRRDR